MSLSKEPINNTISRFDLFSFRRPLMVGDEQVNIFFKADVRSTFASTLDGDIVHANKVLMQSAIKLPIEEISMFSQATDLFKDQVIEAFDLRSHDYPKEIVITGVDAKKNSKHVAVSNDPTLALSLKQFVAEHNNDVLKAQSDAENKEKLAPTVNDKIPPPLNLANCF